MGRILKKICELRVMLVIISILTTGFNCDFFKEKITITPETAFTNLFFPDSANIIYLKTTYDIRCSSAPFGEALSSTENYQYTILSLNIYSGKKDTLLYLPVDQSSDADGNSQLSFCFPILLISSFYTGQSTWFYDIPSKTYGSYISENQLKMSDLPDAAYDSYENILNPKTGKKLFSLPDSGINVVYYSAKNQRTIFSTNTIDSLNRIVPRYWFAVYDKENNTMQKNKISRQIQTPPKNVDHSQYLLFVTNTFDAPTKIDIIHGDSLDMTFGKAESFIFNGIVDWMDVCDAIIDKEWLLIQNDNTCTVRKFNGEVVAGPLEL